MGDRDSDRSGLGRSFNLSEEILSVIPTDPYDQLDLARKLTSMAIASRVASLEEEAGSLRRKLDEKDRIIEELESRLRIANEDNEKLSKEKDSLALIVKKLSRDLCKLEAFKRQLMESLNDDNYSPSKNVDIGADDHSVHGKEANGQRNQNSYSNSTNSKGTNSDRVSEQETNRLSATSAGTPDVNTNVNAKWHSASHSPTYGISSPGAKFDRQGSFSSLFPSSQLSPTANSPRSHSMPGREFFRQARNRLSLEQFSAFLANVKEFNAQKQSREETLRKAEEIFEMDNKDLYLWFHGLLNLSMQ